VIDCKTIKPKARRGRPTTFQTDFAQEVERYTRSVARPSILDFCRQSGHHPRQLRRWELQHPDMTVALGRLRLKQAVAMGRDY
jgi:hypothetical protein